MKVQNHQVTANPRKRYDSMDKIGLIMIENLPEEGPENRQGFPSENESSEFALISHDLFSANIG